MTTFPGLCGLIGQVTSELIKKLFVVKKLKESIGILTYVLMHQLANYYIFNCYEIGSVFGLDCG